MALDGAKVSCSKMSRHLPLKMRFKIRSSGQSSSSQYGEYQDELEGTPPVSPHPAQPLSPVGMQYEPYSPSMYPSPEPLMDASSSNVADCPMSPSPVSSTSRGNVPDSLSMYFPDNILPTQGGAASAEPGPSTSAHEEEQKKEKSFVYFIDGQPIDLGNPHSGAPGRSRHSSATSSMSDPPMTRPHYQQQPGTSRSHADYYQPYDNNELLVSNMLHYNPAQQTPFGPIDPSYHGPNSPAGKAKKRQKCSRCANHDVFALLKGHRPFCTFRNCRCEKCAITKTRQSAVSRQAKLTRDQDAERLKRQIECGPPTRQLDYDPSQYPPPGSGGSGMVC